MSADMILVVDSVRVLAYQFVALSLAFLAISYQNWPRRYVSWVHLTTAAMFSIIGIAVFLDTAGFVELSQTMRSFLVTPMVLVIGGLAWFWLIRREKRKVDKAQQEAVVGVTINPCINKEGE